MQLFHGLRYAVIMLGFIFCVSLCGNKRNTTGRINKFCAPTC